VKLQIRVEAEIERNSFRLIVFQIKPLFDCLFIFLEQNHKQAKKIQFRIPETWMPYVTTFLRDKEMY
jgi:hypothetical protein